MWRIYLNEEAKILSVKLMVILSHCVTLSQILLVIQERSIKEGTEQHEKLLSSAKDLRKVMLNLIVWKSSIDFIKDMDKRVDIVCPFLSKRVF